MVGSAVEVQCGRHRLTDGYVVLKVNLHLFECIFLKRGNTQNWWQ